MREYYLQALGIEQWVLRDSVAIEPSVLPSGYQCELYHAGQCVGVLYATSAAKEPAIQTMLKKIIGALQLTGEVVWYASFSECRDVSVRSMNFAITMGECELSFNDLPIVRTVSPERLLAEPSLKRVAWDALQAVASYLS